MKGKKINENCVVHDQEDCSNCKYSKLINNNLNKLVCQFKDVTEFEIEILESLFATVTPFIEKSNGNDYLISIVSDFMAELEAHIRFSKQEIIDDICSNCVESVGIFYENTGTCEGNMFLGECNFKPLKERTN